MKVNHLSCVEISGGKAVYIIWSKSAMNSITAFSSAMEENVGKDYYSSSHPVQTFQNMFPLNGFAFIDTYDLHFGDSFSGITFNLP